MSTLAVQSGSFEEVYSQLLSLPSPLLNPSKPSDSSFTDKISSLYVHPSLEIALHILNNDLVSAHFLVRHMESAPAFEAMFLHGILHRIEGDWDNARAWYRDVAEQDVFKAVWNSKETGLKLIDDVEAFVKDRKGEKGDLEQRSLTEIKAVVEFLMKKFGTESRQNVKDEFSYAKGENRKTKEAMLLGDRGHRNM